ncbi:hypothetical protein [Rhodanobacter umsongensis]
MNDEITFLQYSDLGHEAPVEVSAIAAILGLDEDFVWSEVHRGKLLVTIDELTSAQFARAWWCDVQIDRANLQQRFREAQVRLGKKV